MKRSQLFFVWVLPVIWAVASYAHSYYTGDEHGMYILSCIVGTWIHFFIRLPEGLKDPMFAVITSLTGAVVFASVGIVMDLMRVRRMRWAIIFMAAMMLIFATMLRAQGSIERALAKNGSWWTYTLSATVLGLYVSVFLCMLGNGLLRTWRIITGYSEENEFEIENDK